MHYVKIIQNVLLVIYNNLYIHILVNIKLIILMLVIVVIILIHYILNICLEEVYVNNKMKIHLILFLIYMMINKILHSIKIIKNNHKINKIHKYLQIIKDYKLIL